MHKYKLLAISLALPLAHSAHAAWEITPQAMVEVGVEDNIRLTPRNEEDATVTTAEVSGQFKNVTERSFVDVRAIARYTDFGDSSVDATDTQRLRLDAERRGERWAAGVRSQVTRDSLIRYGQVGGVDASGEVVDDGAEVVSPGDDVDPIDTEQGTIEVDVDRLHIQARPYLRYQVSERSRLTVEGIYSKREYDNLQGLVLRDSEEKGAALGYDYRLSERDTVDIKVQQTTFEPDGLAEADLRRATVGWARRLSERTRWRLEAGVRESDPDQGSKESGLHLSASLNHRTELDRFLVLAQRSNTPSAFGDTIEYDRILANWQRKLTEKWSLDATAQYTTTESENLAFNGNLRDRDYGELFLGVRRALTPEWSLGAEFRHRYVDRASDSGTAHSNGFYISIQYSPITQF